MWLWIGLEAVTWACSCLAPPPPDEALRDAAAVFQGEVIGTAEGSLEQVWRFRVQQAWKGVAPGTEEVLVATATSGTACGLGFSDRQVWLVYAHTGGHGLSASSCGRSSRVKPGVPLPNADVLGTASWEAPGSKSATWRFVEAVQAGDVLAAQLAAAGRIDAKQLPHGLADQAAKSCQLELLELLAWKGQELLTVPPGAMDTCDDGQVDTLLQLTGPERWRAVLEGAAMSGDTDTLRKMLDAGVSPESRTPGMLSPLDNALRIAQLQTARMLWEHGAEVPPHTVELARPYPELADLVAAGPTKVDVSTLCQAAVRARGDLEQLRSLLDQGLEPGECGREELGMVLGYGTPLVAAQSIEAIDLLLEAGASLDETSRDGMTRLHYAASGGQVELVEALVERGADVNARAHAGTTPLYYAAKHGHAEVTRALVRLGADIEAATDSGSTPLHVAAWNDDNLPALEVLLELGADPSAVETNRQGLTPLGIAERQGAERCAEVLRAAAR